MATRSLRNRARSARMWVFLAIALAVTLPATALATHWAASQYRFGAVRSTWRTSYDSVRQATYVRFTSTQRANLLAMEASSPPYYYTADSHDMNQHLNASGYFTSNIPNPFYDKDDDNNDNKSEEAEVTSENLSFPASTTTEYYAFFEYSHWAFYPGSPYFNRWIWDSGGGNIEHDAQLSVRSCGICDKYDAAPLTPRVYGNVSYPSLVYTGGTAAPAVAPSTGPALSTARLEAAPKHVGLRVRKDGKVSVQPLLDGGLDAYRAQSRAAARSLVAAGAAQGVVTFMRPLSPAEFAAFEKTGLHILSIEAIARDGSQIVTVGGPWEPGSADRLAGMAKEVGAKLDGIVAAEVVVPDETALAAADAHPSVYLVDLSVELVRRWAGPKHEVGMNDLYWTLAGLN